MYKKLRIALALGIFGIGILPVIVLALPVSTVVDETGDVGRDIAVAIGSDNLPIMAYYDLDNQRVKVAHCSNAACTSSTLTTLAGTAQVSEPIRIGIGGDGRAVILYMVTDPELRLTHCTNVTCTSSTTEVLSSSPGGGTSMTIGEDGFAFITYYDNGFVTGLTGIHCGDATCSSTNSVVLDTAEVQQSSTTMGTNWPIISYYDYDNHDLKFIQCLDADCSSTIDQTLLSAGDVGRISSIALGDDSLPVVSYYDTTNGNVGVVRCDEEDCSGTNSNALIATAGDVGSPNAIAIGSDGFPVVSYYDGTNFSLHVAHCEDVACVTSTTTTLADGGDWGFYHDIVIGTDGYPFIGYFDFVDVNALALHCDSVTCTDITAPAAPGSFAATSPENDVFLSWTNPVDSDFDSVTIRRSTSGYPASISDGDAVTSALVDTEYEDSDLSDGTYYYSIFAKDTSDNYSLAANTSATVNTITVSSTNVETSSGGGGGRGSRRDKAASIPSSAQNVVAHPAALPSYETTSKDLYVRTCNRVTKWFGDNPKMLRRVNERLQKRFGFTCQG